MILTAGGRSGGGPAADGRMLSVPANSALFALLGTTFGGDGMTTFALPDLRAVAPTGTVYRICTDGIYPSME